MLNLVICWEKRVHCAMGAASQMRILVCCVWSTEEITEVFLPPLENDISGTLSGLKGPQVVRRVSLQVCSQWQSRLLNALIDNEILNYFWMEVTCHQQ